MVETARRERRTPSPAQSFAGPLRAAVCALLCGCASGEQPGTPPWTRIDTSGVAGRWGHVAVYDGARDRLLTFGGENAAGQLDETLALDLSTRRFARLPTTGTPSPRTDLAGVLDAPRDRLVVVGGRQGLATSIGEVWALDLPTGAWRRLPDGPSPRHDISAATDGQRAWIFGGAGELFQSLDDLWELDLATDAWRLLPGDGDRPSARTSGAIAFHDGAVIVDGGHDVAMVHNDAWRYDLAARRWSRLRPSGSSVAGAHFGVAFDAGCAALYLSGGDNLDNFDVSFTDALVLGAAPRFARVPTSKLPPVRDHPSLVLDSRRRTLVLYGGGRLGDGLPTLDDAWAYALAGCP